MDVDHESTDSAATPKAPTTAPQVDALATSADNVHVGSSLLIIPAEAVFPRTKRTEGQAHRIIRFCKDNNWELALAPSQLTTGGEVDLAGVKVQYLAPLESDITAWLNNGKQGSAETNRMTIINTLNSVEYLKFRSYWTGDAEDEEGSINGSLYKGMTRSLAGVADKHCTMLKVSHHGSQKSNNAGFFKLVTAECMFPDPKSKTTKKNKNGNPGIGLLQWIMDGHHQKSVRTAASATPIPPPEIWITNPWYTDKRTQYTSNADKTPRVLNLDFAGGARIWQRSAAGGARDTHDGYLHFTVRNGLVAQTPQVEGGITDVTAFDNSTAILSSR